ncbi:MAG: ABC transporter permease subunit [Planctomycetaceae bacterium]|nr:ABC transporter permease subunit [Planctomycetaceae bacterium]
MNEFRSAVQNLFRTQLTTDWALTLGVVGALFVAILVICYATQIGIIARATTKEAIRQPVFFLLLGIGITLLVLNTFLPFFSLGEDVKMLKDCGLAIILFFGMFLSIWTSSTSIADEIEGKTAMTLLSKPINRRQFVVGKFLGIFNGAMSLMIPLMIVFLVLIFYKVGYDAREGGTEVMGIKKTSDQVTVADRLDVVVNILPSLVLVILEVTIMTAVSVAISTRLPMVVNIVTCMTIFVVGHLTPVLVKTVFQTLEPVKFMAQVIATLLPALESFNTQVAVATSATIPPSYLGYAALYCAIYCMAAILLAFILFEDRDLA